MTATPPARRPDAARPKPPRPSRQELDRRVSDAKTRLRNEARRFDGSLNELTGSFLGITRHPLETASRIAALAVAAIPERSLPWWLQLALRLAKGGVPRSTGGAAGERP